MARKVFVSYKYSDKSVLKIENIANTTCRDYVDELQKLLDQEDHIYKGENDDEPLSSLSDSSIGSKLGDKIFDSTVTIVLISKGMRTNTPEKDQWMPWEISYSLKEQSREGKNSKTNAILAVVVPDENGSYDYFIKENTCPHCNSRTLMTNSLFQILRDNMFNIKKPEYTDCSSHNGGKPYKGYSSYIYSVKWSEFIGQINTYIDIAHNIRKNINDYELTKTIK